MKIPTATYRIQFSPDFGFERAAGIVEYLSQLGVDWLYASPVLKAGSGSTHGYDVTDPGRINPSLGSEAQYAALVDLLHRRGMGWLQDAVPNHMAYSGENILLADLFVLGKQSAYFPFFDVDWGHPAEALTGRLAAPFLGERREVCLQKGQIRPEMRAGVLGAAYFEHFFPFHLSTYGVLLPEGGDDPLPETDGRRWREAVRTLTQSVDRPPSPERDRNIREGKQTLQDLIEGRPETAAWVDRRLKRFDPQTGGPQAAVALEGLLDCQVFRLRHWETASREINYRRFFDINGLIGLRQERSAVFDHTHRLLRRLAAEGRIDGLRIDHVDGLRDPAGYLRRLRSTFGDIYIAVEKILGPGETLPRSWPVDGTSGYEFSDRLTRLFCAPDRSRIDAVYGEFSGRTDAFDAVCRQAKRQVLQESFSGELDNLVRSLRAGGAQFPGSADDFRTLRGAVAEILVRFPVYRTYADRHPATGDDADLIGRIVAESARHRPDLVPALNAVEGVLTGEPDSRKVLPAVGAEARAEALVRFQQLCAPLAAKGIEDTALYRFFPLASVNEVGGDPAAAGLSAEAFIAFLSERLESWPNAMNALSTHDSKRAADVRARLNVLSEMPDRWARHCNRWKNLNRDKKDLHNGRTVPDANTEYLLYQTLLGTFPFDPQPLEDYARRVRDYMVKAVREGKENSSWHSPDTGFEAALCRFVDRLLLADRSTDPDPFWADFIAIAETVARFGVYNALAMALIQITAPGVPDLYQGSELFDFSLVDPDNRRPVDFARRIRLLEEIRSRQQPGPPHPPAGVGKRGLYDRWKLHLVHSALQVRKQMPDLFQSGKIVPVGVSGRFARHVAAFARIHGGQCSITAVPRLVASMRSEAEAPLAGAWRNTSLTPPGGFPSSWSNVLSGNRVRGAGSLPLAAVFDRFPAALLTSEVTR